MTKPTAVEAYVTGTVPTQSELRAILTEFEADVRADEMVGAQDPADWPAIEHNLKLSRMVLHHCIVALYKTRRHHK